LEVTFRKQRKRIAAKLQDPKIIQIQFHIFRHWKATIEYTKTKEQWYVQKLLGNKTSKQQSDTAQLLSLPQNEGYSARLPSTGRSNQPDRSRFSEHY
jgi:integrase